MGTRGHMWTPVGASGRTGRNSVIYRHRFPPPSAGSRVLVRGPMTKNIPLSQSLTSFDDKDFGVPTLRRVY